MGRNLKNTRKDIIKIAKEANISEKLMDETLKALVDNGEVERDERKPEIGRGGKSFFYRIKQNDSVSVSTSEIETETE